MGRLLEKLMDAGMSLIIGLSMIFAIGLFVLIGFVAYDSTVSDKLTLTKANWRCVKSEETTTYVGSTVGNVSVLNPITVSSCVNYVRK